MAAYMMNPREAKILQSYRRMGLNPENVEGYKAQLAQADKMRLIAMDPNKSKSMTQEEKEFYMNQPSMLLRSVGGFEADYSFGGSGERKKKERGSARTTAAQGSRLQAQTPRLDAMRKRNYEMPINRPEMNMSGYA
jgi:hypothetical protein